jgi:hypothetical protein
MLYLFYPAFNNGPIVMEFPADLFPSGYTMFQQMLLHVSYNNISWELGC